VVSSDNSNIIETVAKIFQNKGRQDDVSDTIKEEDLQEIAGRVTKGSEEAYFIDQINVFQPHGMEFYH